jgi:DNA-binding protein HU-beta
MNKTQLVDALAERLGDRRTAATAVDGLLETIVDVVRSGGSVTLTGFGVFEGRPRAARTARNPRTGEPVEVPATTVPAFRPGATFRTAVGGTGAAAPPAVVSAPVSAPVAAAVVEDPAPAQPATAAKSGKSGKSGKAGGGDREKAGKSAKSRAKDDKPKKGKKK